MFALVSSAVTHPLKRASYLRKGMAFSVKKIVKCTISTPSSQLSRAQGKILSLEMFGPPTGNGTQVFSVSF